VSETLPPPALSGKPLLLQSGQSIDLISNGNFDAPAGAATGWTSRASGRTRFGYLGDLIGPVPVKWPVHPHDGRVDVARFCGYPYRRTVTPPEGGFTIDDQTCSDSLNSQEFTIPAETTSIELKMDVFAAIQCGAGWSATAVLWPTGSSGSKIPAIRINAAAVSAPNWLKDNWNTMSYTVPENLIAGMKGQTYQFRILSSSGLCRDPEMEESIALVTGIRLIAR
jgi:hypothetical protein